VTKEPYLSSVLRNIYEHKLSSLLKKTRIEMSTDDGRIMMGTADDTGSLCYGEVYVQYSVNIDRPQEETKILEGTVVVAKNPCFHPGDLRKFTAVNKPQLKHMIDCIVFPTQGSRPHPDEMSGSDLDGDMYFVCWNNQLQPPGVSRAPMNYQPKPKEVLDRPVTESDMIEFIGKYIEGDRLGVIANSHLAHADGQERGIFSQQCLDLAQMHSDAVDFPKTGVTVRITPELRPRQYPHYMLKRDKLGYWSEHVLGKLFDQCQSIMSNRGKHVLDLETCLDENFLVPGYGDYLPVAHTIHDYYRRNIERLINEYGISTETEIVTGHILKLRKQRRGTLQRENVEIAEIINVRLKTITSRVKEMFFQAADKQSDKSSVERSRLASALYFVTYSELAVDSTCLSLPWIFVDHLLSARRFRANPESTSPTSHTRQFQSLLEQLSREVVEFKDTSRRLDETREQRKRAFQRLSVVMKELESVQMVLPVFGSHATGFDDTASSLDVLCDVKSRAMSQECLDQIINSMKEKFNFSRLQSFKLGSKPITFNDDVNRIKVCLYTDITCIRRTVYIISAVANNSWIVPVLHIMLCWAKRSKITGNDRGNTMTTEQFILLFLSYFSQNVADHQLVDAEDQERVMELIVQNHFIDCKASTCTHARKLNTSLQSLQISDDATNHSSDEGHKNYANVILNFLNWCSRLQGAILKEVVDPVIEDGETKLFNLKELQCQRLAERMLKAYHTLAQSGHFADLVKESKLSDEHLLIYLPQQVCKRILLTEKSYEDKLKRESQAEVVVIRKRPYRDYLAGLVLEAWGSLQSLQLLRDLIADEAKANLSLDVVGSTHYAIKNAMLTVFKNCSSDLSAVVFVRYGGPCQAEHDRLKRYLPCVRRPHLGSSFSRDKFVERSLQQLNRINDNYDENVHGKMRAVISYGTFYIANSDTYLRELPVSEFDDLLKPTSRKQTNRLDPIHPRGGNSGRGMGRTRERRVGPGRYFVPQPSNYRASFIPAGNQNIDSSRLQNFLHKNGFILVDEKIAYRLALRLDISGEHRKLSATVGLDKNFNLVFVNMADNKWLYVTVVSSHKDFRNRPYDCRFKLLSNNNVTVLQSEVHKDDFADIIAKHRAMLLRDGDEVYGVHSEFRKRLSFVRRKHMKVYRLAANQHGATTDAFLYGMEIRINYGTEYSRPSMATGEFLDVDRNRVEVTAVPELPDLRDEDKMRTFFTKCWQFAEELGSVLE